MIMYITVLRFSALNHFYNTSFQANEFMQNFSPLLTVLKCNTGITSIYSSFSQVLLIELNVWINNKNNNNGYF